MDCETVTTKSRLGKASPTPSCRDTSLSESCPTCHTPIFKPLMPGGMRHMRVGPQCPVCESVWPVRDTPGQQEAPLPTPPLRETLSLASAPIKTALQEVIPPDPAGASEPVLSEVA